MLMLLALGCSEHGFNDKPTTPNLGPDDGVDDGDDDPNDGDPNPPTDPNNPTPPITSIFPPSEPDPLWPPTEAPPRHLPNDCDADQLATFSSSEIWVGAHGNTHATGSIESPEAGWYHVYNTHIVESGATQHNESAFFRISNPTRPDGVPAFANCADEYVVVDGDNAGPPSGNQTLIGTFWLDEGTNDLAMIHYCELYRIGLCPEHHIDTPSDQTCDTDNINSVHFTGFGLCLVPEEL